MTSRVQKLVKKWKDEWMFPKTDPNHLFRQDLSIPESLTVKDLGPSHVAVSSRGVNYYDAIMNDSEDTMDVRGLPDLDALIQELNGV